MRELRSGTADAKMRAPRLSCRARDPCDRGLWQRRCAMSIGRMSRCEYDRVLGLPQPGAQGSTTRQPWSAPSSDENAYEPAAQGARSIELRGAHASVVTQPSA